MPVRFWPAKFCLLHLSKSILNTLISVLESSWTTLYRHGAQQGAGWYGSVEWAQTVLERNVVAQNKSRVQKRPRATRSRPRILCWVMTQPKNHQAKYYIQSGAETCYTGFVRCFQAVGLNCSCHAAHAIKGNKHSYNILKSLFNKIFELSLNLKNGSDSGPTTKHDSNELLKSALRFVFHRITEMEGDFIMFSYFISLRGLSISMV